MTMTLDEAQIQNLLYQWCDRKCHQLIIPNTFVMYAAESDLVSVHRGLAIEFEIKTSRADYRAEFKKPRHTYLSQRSLPDGWISSSGKLYAPSQFYFVTPRGLIRPEEVPRYAGLMYADPPFDLPRYRYDYIKIVKRAPKIHAVPIPTLQMARIARGLMFRYWRLRLKQPGRLIESDAV